MKKLTLSLVGLSLLALSQASLASCIGSSAFQSCYDSRSGNSYTIQRSGGTTYTNGYNARTGSSWSSTSDRFGQRGFDSNGNYWSR